MMQKNNSTQNESRITLGVVLIVIGVFFILFKIPYFKELIIQFKYLINLPIILIAIGILKGAFNGFRDNSWWIITLIGIFWYIQKFDILNIKNFIAPIILILIGGNLILRNRRRKNEYANQQYLPPAPSDATEAEYTDTSSFQYQSETQSSHVGESFKINTILGSGDKRVFDKNFKGGEITCFMGGSNVDLTMADIQHSIVIDINVVMGGVEISIPNNWVVRNEMNVYLGGLEDKRRHTNMPNPEKVVILKGLVIMGGIEIKSY